MRYNKHLHRVQPHRRVCIHFLPTHRLVLHTMTPQPTTVQSPDAGAIIVNDPDAFAIFLERVRPVIEFLEAEKNKLPPQLCALLDSDTESDLTPSEVTQLLKQ